MENIVKTIKSAFTNDQPPDLKKRKAASEGANKKRPTAEGEKKEKKPKGVAIVGPERDKASFIDLNKIIDKKKKKVENDLGKLADGCDTDGPGKDQKAHLAEMATLAKRLVVTKDLTTNAMKVDETKEKEKTKEKPKQKMGVTPAELPYEKVDAKLEELAKKYKTEKEKLLKTLEQVSGNVVELERHLRGEPVSLWTEFEDIALSHPENSDMMKYLVEKKGEKAVAARKKYLGIASS